MWSRSQFEPRGSQENAAPRRHRRVDCTQATWVGLASSGFILLPAGRDVVAMETPILPGDEELIAAMTMANPDARRWFWGMSGPVRTSNCRVAVGVSDPTHYRLRTGGA